MGNRGILHNADRQIVRNHKSKTWIYCTLIHKDWHREVMKPNNYTELFFLDDFTALSAGHRPCALCQRAKFNAFKSVWKEVNKKPNFSLKEIDAFIHEERRQLEKPILVLAELPHGVMIRVEDNIFLNHENGIRKWSFTGYEKPTTFSPDSSIELITPVSITRMFSDGRFYDHLRS